MIEATSVLVGDILKFKKNTLVEGVLGKYYELELITNLNVLLVRG